MISDKIIRRWKKRPTGFIEQVLRDPETGRPFQLFDAERNFLEHSYKLGANNRLVYPEQVYSGPKKIGKTAFAAMHLITTTLLFGGRFSESFVCANDMEQAQSRVFQAACRIIQASPLLRKEARITANKITFPATGATITALASDYAGAAGAAPTESCFDELFAYTREKSRRLFDEMVPTPTKIISLRLTVTTAGFSSESALLEELYKRGLAQPQIGPDLYGGDGLLMFWTSKPQAPWQDANWLRDMERSLRPAQFRRMILNEFVVSESSFIEPAKYEECVDPNHRPVLADPSLPVWIGIDASVRHDSTGIIAVTYDRTYQRLRVVAHKIFQPSPEHPLDFEGSLEQTILAWHSAFKIKGCLFDPYQMFSSAQRLSKLGVKMREFPQTTDRLTAASQNLFELIQGRNIVFYANPDIRLAMMRAVAVEGSRGWRISKEKASHKIDIVVALSMAALGAVREGPKRDLRQFAGPSTYGSVGSVEIDPSTGEPLRRLSRLVRDEDGQLRLISDNRCTGQQIN